MEHDPSDDEGDLIDDYDDDECRDYRGCRWVLLALCLAVLAWAALSVSEGAKRHHLFVANEPAASTSYNIDYTMSVIVMSGVIGFAKVFVGCIALATILALGMLCCAPLITEWGAKPSPPRSREPK